MILSILIPTIPSRDKVFTRLLHEVNKQCTALHRDHPSLGKVEILWNDSLSYLEGGLSIGKKREAMVKKCSGKYLCFLDDDEDIAPNYTETLVRLCHHDRDVCTFRAIAKNDNFWSIIDMSIYHPNIEASPNYITLRAPWHVCPVRSEFAKMYNFENINYGEDFKWMEKVLTHATSEARTTAVLLQYNHSSKTSEADKITNYGKDRIQS